MTKTDKQNQHYVPKFYLRAFSTNNDRRQIGLLNVRSGFYFPSASLKTQACKSFFYGKDGILEETLANVERHQSALLNKMIAEDFIPSKNTKEHIELLGLVILTQLRNPISSDKQNESLDSMLKTVFRDYPGINDGRFVINNAPGLSISVLNHGIDCCRDLEYKMVINLTDQPFITSDNPVVKYNQMMEFHKYKLGSTGLGCLGLLMFFPLNPKKLLILYDRGCYKVGNKSQRAISITDVRDVTQINRLQILNCSRNVFFNNEVSEALVKKLNEDSKKFQRPHQVITKQFTKVNRNGIMEPDSVVVMSTTTECKTNLGLSFLKLLDKAKYANIDNGIVQVRPTSTAHKPLTQPRTVIAP